MANVYVALPVPAADGVGAWANVSTLAPNRTISVDGGPFTGKILVECSNDAQVSASPSDILPFFADQQVALDFLDTYQFMRVRRVGTDVVPGTPTVKVGAELSTSNIFGAMNVPAGDGVGTAFNLTGGGAINTFTVVGGVGPNEILLIEGSTDAGATWSPLLRFDSGGGVSQTFNGVLAAARVRRRGSFGASAPVVAVGSGGELGGATPPGTGVLQFDSVRVVGTQLASFVTTGLPKGTIAYVGNDTFAGQNSVHRYFSLVYGEARPPSGVTIVNSPTFGSDGAQWLSLDTVDQAALSRLFWAVDPANVSGVANDENNGWGTSLANARLSPLLTFDELNRRNVGRTGGSQPAIALMSDDAATPIMTNFVAKNGTDQPTIIGDLTQLGGDYVVTSYLTAVPSSNLGYILIAPGLGAAGNLGKLVTNAAQNKWAFIQEVDGANQARLTQPNNWNPINFSGSFAVDFVAAETVRVWNMPSLSQWPFPSGSAFPTVWHAALRFLAPTFNHPHFDGSSPSVGQCIIDGMIAEGGFGIWAGNQFAGHQSVFIGSNDNQLLATGIRDVILEIRGGSMVISQNLDVTGTANQLQTTGGAAVAADASSTLSAFNTALTPFRVVSGRFVATSPAPLFGNVTAGGAFSVGFNASGRLTRAQCFASTAGLPLEVAGVSYAYADLPITDPDEGAYISTN